MRRWLAYLLIWSIGTAATVGGCWLGLRSVLNAAVPQRSVPFSAAEFGRSTAAPTTPGAGDGTAAQLLAQPLATAVPAATAASPRSSTNQPAAQPAAPAATTSPTSQWEPIPDGHGGTAYRRTFHVQAGDLTFYAAPFDVHLIDSDVQSGYLLVPTRYDIRSLLISLVSHERTSRVYVAWRDGPYAEVTETVS